MAVDTAAKRRAFMGMPWMPNLPRPDGALSQIERFGYVGVWAFNVVPYMAITDTRLVPLTTRRRLVPLTTNRRLLSTTTRRRIDQR